MDGACQLLLEIAHCRVVKDIRDRKVLSHCCQTIVGVQTEAEYHLPEPWVGEIDHAPILFISSNPSIDTDEVFPNDDESTWPPERIADFFQNRFRSHEGWVKDGRYVLRHNGYSGSWVRFWASARVRASEILQIKKTAVVPGVDFALTEIVHCKSRNEMGVAEAQAFCSDRYLGRILSIAAARILIVYGTRARQAICRHFGLGAEETTARIFGPTEIAGTSRMLVFLPHPSARRANKSFHRDELDALRRYRESKS